MLPRTSWRLAVGAAALVPVLGLHSPCAAQGQLVEDDLPMTNAVIPAAQGGTSVALLASTGSDSCATPDPITGTGAFPFDNTAATTGVEGQFDANCSFYNNSNIFLDVWFVWTAPSTGRIQFSTCGQTAVDTRVAIHPAGACPSSGGPALACNDDVAGNIAPGNFQSWLQLDVTAATQYLIQLGSYPNTAGGSGTFSIHYLAGGTCQYDDGTSENAQTVGTQNTLRSTGWIHAVGRVGETTTVTTVSTVWGWTGTGSPLPAGLTGEVAVWEDPNDDGDPADAVLLGSGSAPMVGQHTDAFQAIPLTSSVNASGVFFIGAWVTHTTGFPAPRDVSGCSGEPFKGWLVGNAGLPLDTANLALNSTPPFQSTNGNSYLFLLRADCTGGPVSTGTTFCSGDGTATACPCGNSGAAGNGCASSVNANGGNLSATGNASLTGDTVVLAGTGMPNSSALYFQGTTQQNAGNGSAFGDGLRCAGGTVVRLGTTANVGGASMYPFGANPSVSVKGNISMLTAPVTRTYQIWYRNAAAFCTASTFNLTNGLEIVWGP
jgi:hypothetical protein